MFKYAKFSSYYLISLLGMCFLLLGGYWIAIGFALLTAVMMGGDALFGDDISTPEYGHPSWLTLLLWLALPFTLLLVLVNIWLVADADWLGIGAQIGAIAGVDLLAARESNSWLALAIAVPFSGLMLSVLATVTAHELVHRTRDKVSVSIGRWLLAFSFDANFSIEHVYGHHLHVATPADPASAPRGRSVYAHMLISTVKGNISAWNIEAKRLSRSKKALFSWHNRCLRGYAMTLVLWAGATLLAGWQGAVMFLAIGLAAKALLEIVNYMEHYGLVRAPNKKVEPRHSWNTNRRCSNWMMFNLARHSHHHAQGAVPFHRLRPYPDAPEMINGYLATIFITLIPPLWHRLMAPKLEEWDERYASEEELILLRQQHTNCHAPQPSASH
ncbi:alkane 1-monooxygenase [Aestuariibacter salexigens]|uniref:alkane 1-monooxygenase n=1 Tax=Aestuariibacter salexigens TaxID=226010 RepID=UPI000409630A|nr:alkane 1-monooxygenase [Aestuariibacter salexigens]